MGPDCSILGNYSLKKKKVLTSIGDKKNIFKLQDVNFLVNGFLSFFQIWNEVLLKSNNLMKTLLLGMVCTLTLGVYKLFRNDLIILESIKSRGWFFWGYSLNCQSPNDLF